MELIHKIWLLLFFGDSNPWWQLLSFQWVTFLTRPWDASFTNMFMLGGVWLLFWMVLTYTSILMAYYVTRAFFHFMWGYITIVANVCFLPISLVLLILGWIPIIGIPFKTLRSFLGGIVKANSRTFYQANENFLEECRTTDDTFTSNPAAMAYFYETMSKSSKK